MSLLPSATGLVPSNLRIVGFIGFDGSGTTTHTDHSVDVLEDRGYTTQTEWMRFNYRSSIPVLALARLLGMSVMDDDGTAWAHTFEDSYILRNIFFRTALLDQRILALEKFRSISQNTDFLVCDRFILDGLIDIIVSTSRLDLLESSIADGFWNLVPEQAVLIGLNCDTETVVSRRPDVTRDPLLEMRVDAYKKLYQDDRIHVVDTSQPFESAKAEIEQILEEQYDITS